MWRISVRVSRLVREIAARACLASAGRVSMTWPPTPAWTGLVLQTCHLPADLTVRELVGRYAAYYPHPRGIDQTIDHVGLGTKQKARAGSLSGGQQRRLDVALALIGDPDLIFLDEPTTGFDPAARHQAWDMIGNRRGPMAQSGHRARRLPSMRGQAGGPAARARREWPGLTGRLSRSCQTGASLPTVRALRSRDTRYRL